MELSVEQQLAFDKFVEGKNVFITGPGGSGKSALIKKIWKYCLSNEKKVSVTALTGCAAILLDCKATTLHSWAGIGLGNGSLDDIVTKILKNKNKKKNWKVTSVLIVDEVSMLSLKLFNLLNAIGKQVREDRRPFGGLQIIFSGDFYQLPPVGDKDDIDSTRFCFESEDWNASFPTQIELVKIFRQKDETYATILNQLRQGILKKKTVDILSSLVGKEKPKDLIVEPTKLFPTRLQVDEINSEKMKTIDSEIVNFEMQFLKDLPINTMHEKTVRSFFHNDDIVREFEFIANNLICDKFLNVKLGSQVMCIVNIKDEFGVDILCNGSQGKITGFCLITKAPIVLFNNGITKTMSPYIWLSEKIPGVGVSQIPLILAWALTIHKSQGASLDSAEIDAGSGIFECGQTYVALSRVKSLEGLYLTSFDISKIRINKKVKEFYQNLSLREKEKEEEKEIKDINIKVIKLKL
jgi:ATP-dependent DNA helicase PIF1